MSDDSISTAGSPNCGLSRGHACPTLELRVTKLGGESVELTLKGLETVVELKRRLSKYFCCTPWKQTILHQGTTLENHEQLIAYAGRDAFIELVLIVLESCPPIVESNTKKLAETIKSLAPAFRPRDRPGRTHLLYKVLLVKTMERVVEVSSVASASDAIRWQRKLKRRLKTSKGREGLALPSVFKKTLSRTQRFDQYFLIQRAFGGLDAELELAIKNEQVDLCSTFEGMSFLQKAFAVGCGTLASTLLRSGADADSVSMHHALKFFDGDMLSIYKQAPYRLSSLFSDDLPIVSRGAEDFDLVRAICELRRLKSQRRFASVSLSVSIARALLSQAATEMALLQPLGAKCITKQDIVEAASLNEDELNLFGDELWSGWPVSFLTFSDPPCQSRAYFDPQFARVRMCMLRSMCNTRDKPKMYHCSDHWVDRSSCSTEYSGLEGEIFDYVEEEANLRKSRNLKWQRSVRTYADSRCRMRVPWATAKGSHYSYSARLARRMPRGGYRFETKRKFVAGRIDPNVDIIEALDAYSEHPSGPYTQENATVVSPYSQCEVY